MIHLASTLAAPCGTPHQMPDLLVARADGSLLHSKPLLSRATVTIGRHPEGGVVIPDDRVSRRHALVFEHEGDWYAVDLDSTGGIEGPGGPTTMLQFDPAEAWINLGPVVIWVDGIKPKIASPTPRPIKRNQTPILRTREDYVDRAVPGNPSDSTSLLIACHRSDGRQGRLRLLDLAGADRVLIGSDPGCDVVVEDESVAKMDCLIYREGLNWSLVDLRPVVSETRKTPRRRRLGPGVSHQVGPLTLAAVASEPAIPRLSCDGQALFDEALDVPDLGSIFANPTITNERRNPENPGDQND